MKDRSAHRRNGAPSASSGEQQAALAGREGRQLGHHGEAEAVGVGGVDAADEGVDEALVDLVAEAGADQRADRITVRTGGRQQRLDCRP